MQQKKLHRSKSYPRPSPREHPVEQNPHMDQITDASVGQRQKFPNPPVRWLGPVIWEGPPHVHLGCRVSSQKAETYKILNRRLAGALEVRTTDNLLVNRIRGCGRKIITQQPKICCAPPWPVITSRPVAMETSRATVSVCEMGTWELLEEARFAGSRLVTWSHNSAFWA